MLSEHVAVAATENEVRRVAIGQRFMQSATDVFLGWSSEPASSGTSRRGGVFQGATASWALAWCATRSPGLFVGHHPARKKPGAEGVIVGRVSEWLAVTYAGASRYIRTGLLDLSDPKKFHQMTILGRGAGRFRVRMASLPAASRMAASSVRPIDAENTIPSVSLSPAATT